MTMQFIICLQDENEEVADHSNEDHLQDHGVLNPKVKISITLDLEVENIVENDDNQEIFTNLKEQNTIFQNKLVPMVKKWVVTLTKAGSEICDSHLLKKAIDIKTSFDDIENKACLISSVMFHTYFLVNKTPLQMPKLIYCTY